MTSVELNDLVKTGALPGAGAIIAAAQGRLYTRLAKAPRKHQRTTAELDQACAEDSGGVDSAFTYR